jgi:hypothetical protein
MKHSLKSAIAIAALGLCATLSFGQTKTDTGLSYNQVGIGYVGVTTTVAGKDYTFSGAGVGATVLAGQNIIFGASSLSASGDVLGNNITISQTSIGIGARAKIAAQTDIYGRVSYIDSKAAALGTSITDNGYGVSVGVNTLISTGVQASVFAGQSKQTKSDASNSFGVGLDVNITPVIVLGGSYISAKDTRQLGLTLSYAF